MSTATTERSRPPRRRARRGEGDRLRADLLDIAEDLLLEKGDADAVSVREIASRAGCSPPAIYLHFDSKDDLFLETCSRRWNDFNTQVMVALAEEDTILGRLEALGRAYLRYGVENPSHYRVLFNSRPISATKAEDLGDELLGNESLDILVATIAAGMETGELRRGDPAAVAIALWGVVHGVVMLVHSAEQFEPYQEHIPDHAVLFDAVMSVTMRGMQADPR